MVSQKKVMKLIILFIVAVFLLSSGLVSVMYFVDMNKKVPAEQIADGFVEVDNVDFEEVLDEEIVE